MMAHVPTIAISPTLAAHFEWTPPVLGAAAVLLIAVAAWGWLRAKGWGAAAGWFALALGGQACAFQLFLVGPSVRLQLFRGWSELLHSWRIVFLVAISLQALLVLFGLWRVYSRDSEFRRRARSLVTWPQSFLFLVIASFACITIAPEVAQSLIHGGFLKMALLHTTKIALGLTILFCGTGSVVLAAASHPQDVWLRIVARWENCNRKRLPWIAALFVVVISSLLAWVPLAGLPHVPDEAAYIFQAKYISTGRVYLPAPPVPEAFPCRFGIVDGDRWYSAMLGGWPFVLAIGVKLGLPWLVNPLLGGLGILLAHLFIRRLYDREIADGVALLLGASPWLLYISASLMPHALSLVLCLLGLLGIERARNSGSILWAGLAGLCFGGLLHVRPLEAVIVATVAGLWWLAAGWKKLRLPALAATVATGLAMTLLFLAYNNALTGDPFYPPVNKFFDLTQTPGSNRLGFGKDIGSWGWTGLDALPGHGPIDVLMNSNQNLHLINFEFLGWAGGSLVLVWLLFVWGKLRRDALMWGFLFALWAGLNLYWFSGGPDFGARYWYLMILPCAALTIRGAREFGARLNEKCTESGSPSAAGASRIWAFMLLATLLGAWHLVLWRALDKYPDYRGVRPDIRALAREHNFGRSLVFVRTPDLQDYHSAFALNPPRYDRPAVDAFDTPLFALDLGTEANERLRMYYRDRPVWMVAGSKLTGGNARVILGPLAPGQSLPADDYKPATKVD